MRSSNNGPGVYPLWLRAVAAIVFVLSFCGVIIAAWAGASVPLPLIVCATFLSVRGFSELCRGSGGGLVCVTRVGHDPRRGSPEIA